MTVLVGEAESRALKWPRVQLGDVAEQCLGKMLDAKKNKGRPLKYLRNPNVQWFKVDVSDLKEMLFEEHEMNRFGLLEGDVVVCEGGEAGRAAIWEGQVRDVKFQKAIHRVRCGPKLHNRFLVHRLMADYHSGRLAEYYTGVTIKHLTGRDLSRYEFELPPVEQQKRIAAILDKADALRAKRRKALEQLDALAQAIFIEMFGDPYTNPMGWDESYTLGDIAEVVSGITKGRKVKDQQLRSVPYLAVANVQDRHLVLEGIKEIEATEQEVSRYKLVSGDLLLTEGGDPDKLGRGTLWFDQLAECIHQNHVFRVRISVPYVRPVFLNWLVGSQRGKRYFMKSAKQTTGIASINMGQLKQFPLIVPPVELQVKFEQRLERLQRLMDEQKRHLAQLDALFSSLQHRAFRGEL
ncbi:restriction endonuclease subunit S [Pseudomonas otitidis]|uniref:restriction endonuclease subunit S n=1 Tax=Metapseudomonas otitidis TaxID=319939 RepID=UPI00244A11E6|nr:restriction endonuclease subunit S [Pseudomonas otitidis]MDH1106772.1 restriction endonuclease subunit S [Pseudomonas otitidis]MDH1160866.1 restriction endonuclease subunit S [Pseudomonas otitidis]MDH1163774.1 restriction endonuclease subunit S [Pseudomonas otitidis]